MSLKKFVHRNITFGGPQRDQGPDVTEFADAVKRRLRHYRLGFLIHFTPHFTPARPNRQTVARCIFALGLTERARRNVLVRGHVGTWTQRKIRNPHLRGPIDRIRERNRKPLLREFRAEHRANQVTVMFDSVTLSEIPDSAPAVAGYTGGKWPTYRDLAARFPRAKHLSIAVSSREDADVLDIEPGNAQPADAPEWVRRQLARRRNGARNYNVARPVVYASASEMAAVLAALEGAGIDRDRVLVWTAHYNYRPHICGPTTCGYLSEGADATQWTDHSGGRNLDESLLRPGFF